MTREYQDAPVTAAQMRRMAVGAAFDVTAEAAPSMHQPGYRPKRYSAGELKRAGVTIIDRDNHYLECDSCGQHWGCRLLPGGSLPRGYWKCSNGCNG